ncbi:MAG: tRNA (guanosine(46)-N7)-methyltransferase TrmB [Bacteroidia bacterium]|nr:tRNA (guanosine(46)-N7)-methyltransferase TrmB [Bacteroidia bacterium]
MARKKSFRKDDFLNFPNAFKEDHEKKGKWKEYFGNDYPLILELGCGKGELSFGLAEICPDRNFIGLDLKSDRLWVAAQRAAEAGLKNLAYQRLDIGQLTDFFAVGEVDGIWITFPDPYPKSKRAPRRLTHYRFLSQYAEILKPGGVIEFKTDNFELFEWSREHFLACGLTLDHLTYDLHHSELLTPETGIKTYYEQRFLKMGMKINYVRFTLEGLHEPPPDSDSDEIQSPV